jgi:hypothetical protein
MRRFCPTPSACFALLAIVLSPGSGRSNLVVSPKTLELRIPAGEESGAALLLTNASDVPIEVRAYLRDARVGTDGNEELVEAGTLARSCAAWIELDEDELRLQPNESRILRFVMRVPGAARGGFWTKLYLEEGVPPTPPEGAGLSPGASENRIA